MPFTTISRFLSYSFPQTSHSFINNPPFTEPRNKRCAASLHQFLQISDIGHAGPVGCPATSGRAPPPQFLHERVSRFLFDPHLPDTSAHAFHRSQEQGPNVQIPAATQKPLPAVRYLPLPSTH